MEQSGATLVEGERINQTVEAGISNAYAYHRPSDESLTKITAIRKAYSDLDALLKKNCPVSRELSTAITNLETSAMWGIKSLVINDPISK